MARATSNGRRKKIQIDNARMAAALDEVARLLEEQDADRFRVAEHSLRRIAPRRFNAPGVAWRPDANQPNPSQPNTSRSYTTLPSRRNTAAT